MFLTNVTQSASLFLMISAESSLFRGSNDVEEYLEEFDKGIYLRYSLLQAAIPRNRLDPPILQAVFVINYNFENSSLKFYT